MARTRKNTKIAWPQVSNMLARARRTYQGRDEQIKEMRSHRYLERKVDVPKAYQKTTKEFRSPIAFDDVQRVVAVLNSGPNLVRVPPQSEAADDLKNAQKRENFLGALLDAMNDEMGYQVPHMARDAQAADGLGIMKLMYYPQRYSTREGFPRLKQHNGDLALYEKAVDQFKRGATIPFGWRDVDPLRYLPVFGHDGKREFVIEVHSVDADAIALQYPGKIDVDPQTGAVFPAGESVAVAQDATQTGASSSLELYEIWDRDKWSLWVEGSQLTNIQQSQGIELDGGKNPFGRIPYFELPGLMTSAREPEKRHLSILYASAAVYDHINTLITEGLNITHLFSFPNWKRVGGMVPGLEDADQLKQREEFVTGVIYDMQLGGDMQALGPPDMGRLWEQVINMMLRVRDQVGLSSLTRGQGLGADASGYLFSQIAAAAQGIYGPLQRSGEKALSEMVQAIQWCIRNTLKTSVVLETVGESGATEWHELGPDDIADYYRAEVRTQPEIPTNAIARGNFAAAMNAAGLMSKRTGRDKYLDLQDPEAERQQLMWEDFQRTPAYMSLVAREFVERRLGGEIEEEAPAPPPPLQGESPNMAGLPGEVNAGPGQGNIPLNQGL